VTWQQSELSNVLRKLLKHPDYLPCFASSSTVDEYNVAEGGQLELCGIAPNHFWATEYRTVPFELALVCHSRRLWTISGQVPESARSYLVVFRCSFVTNSRKTHGSDSSSVKTNATLNWILESNLGVADKTKLANEEPPTKSGYEFIGIDDAHTNNGGPSHHQIAFTFPTLFWG
jgi:hypothetical protein